MYLENTLVIPLVDLEAFDGHRTSRVLSVTHVCKSTMVADPLHAYELQSNNVRGGYDAVGFADLGEKPQTSPPVFVIERRARKNLCSAPLTARRGARRSTYLVEKVDKHLGFISLEAPDDIYAGSTAQE